MSDIKTKYWDEYDQSSIGVGAYTDFRLLASLVKDKNILEVGCGRGDMICKLNESRSRAAIDPSERAITFALQREPGLIDFRVGFAEKLDFDDNTFDFTYSLEVIEHVKEYKEMVKEMVRVTKTGGLIFIQTPNYPIKRVYDFIYWLLKRRAEFADDYTHVSKLSAFELKKVVGSEARVINVYARNIFLDKRFSFLRFDFIKRTIGLVLGQKTIILAKKE